MSMKKYNPSNPTFIIVELGFTGYTYFLTFEPNVDCGYSLAKAVLNVPIINVLSKQLVWVKFVLKRF